MNMLTNCNIHIGMFGHEFPDCTFGKSLCTGIGAERVSSRENLLLGDWVPVCPAG